MADASGYDPARARTGLTFDEKDQVIPGLQVVGSNGDADPSSAVPEPSMLPLFGVGSSGLLFARLRRTRCSCLV